MPEQDEYLIPIFLINGQLESGKTTFISELVEGGQFDDAQKKLIIALEEGEVEYDRQLLKEHGVDLEILTDEEFTIMKEHVVIGENLLCNAPGEIMHMACVIAHQHHEWWDGSGYLGIKGEDIEVPARICAVADVYDALTSVRSYKKAWTAEEAFEIITKEAGTHFEPQVVWAFAKHFDAIKTVQELYKDENANYQH